MCTWCVAQMIPLYCGWTTDLERRMEAHNGLIQAVLSIREGDVLLNWCILKSFHNKQDAQRREYAIKQMTKTKKLRLIEGCKIVFDYGII